MGNAKSGVPAVPGILLRTDIDSSEFMMSDNEEFRHKSQDKALAANKVTGRCLVDLVVSHS